MVPPATPVAASAAPVVRRAGEAALVIEFGDTIDPAIVARVQSLDRAVIAAREAGELPGVLESVPSFRSLAIVLDPLRTTPDEAARAVLALERAGLNEPSVAVRREWCLPVRYGGDHGPDLGELADAADRGVDDLIALHTERVLEVYMLGFLPGFAFLGSIAEPLRQPRRRQPRTRVPAGSVAVAMQLSAVYPWESPGGWHLIGHSPVALFDAAATTPALLRPGDRVRFRAIEHDEHEALCAERASGRLDGERFLTPTDAAS